MSRINHQPIFLLTSTPWRENSLRLEIYSRDHGRIALLARSARARGSELRGILVPFVPLLVSWYGKESLKTLHRAQWQGGWAQPQNRQLLSALYLNELLLKLTLPEDPNPQLFQHFHTAQQAIAQHHNPTIALRHFEWQLLHAAGLAPDCRQDDTRQPIQPHQYYLIQADHAPQAVAENHQSPLGITVSGSLLSAISSQTLTPQHNLAQAQTLTRLFIDHHLPEGIKSRKILLQLNELKKPNPFQAA